MEPVSAKRIELSGFSISPGIAIGTAYRFKQIDLESLRNNTFPIEDILLELERLDRSIEKSKEQLLSLQHAGIENNRKEVADIFAAHIQLLQDSTFLQSIRDAVRVERLNVEHILSIKIGDVEKSFSSIDNETVRTRLFDIQDVYQRLLRNLLEIEHVRVTPLLRAKTHPILIAEHLLPSDIALLEFRHIAGVIIEESSAVSHVAIITRSFGIPTVINVPGITSLVRPDSAIIIDGYTGKVILNPPPSEISSFKRKQNGLAVKKERPAQKQRRYLTRDGVRIRLEANANTPNEVAKAIENGAEGIGLLRSEIYYLGSQRLPEPDEELLFYQQIHEQAKGRPLTIRLLDLGADKSLPYIHVPSEQNPQLGIRGLRYLFSHPQLLQNHLSSVLRSSAYGAIRVLVPFVSIVQEIDYLRHLIEQIITRDHLNRSRIQLGIMVEIPSVIWALPQFMPKVDFLSIGTNDLLQFTFASDREDSRLEEYRRASLPVLLKMMEHIASTSLPFGKDVSVCGEAASDPATASLLIGTGIRSLSTRVNALDTVRREIEGKSIEQVQEAVKSYLRSIDDHDFLFRKSA